MSETMIPPELVAPAFNPASFANRDDVHAIFTRLRKDYPLSQVEVPGYDPHWIVTKYADLREIARQDESSAEREARLWLEDAMARLGPDLRDTVALVLGEELTQAEAAKVLGVSEGTVAWRMSEVKKRLRRMAQEEAQ